MKLTRDEVRMVVALLSVLLIGTTVKHCRDRERAASRAPAPAAGSADERK